MSLIADACMSKAKSLEVGVDMVGGEQLGGVVFISILYEIEWGVHRFMDVAGLMKN